MNKYINTEKLKAELNTRIELLKNGDAHPEVMKRVEGVIQGYKAILSIIDSLQQEQPIKDESLGSPDYERGFKHGRDFQEKCELKKTDEQKVISYLISKGYPVSTNGNIPSYEETFELIKNTIEYANQLEQPDVDLEKEVDRFLKSEESTTYENAGSYKVAVKDPKKIARHFYNLRLNAKKDKLPEIDLDKFTDNIDIFQGRYKYPEIVSIKGAMAFMARMFYQYPNVARQWYDSLPKTATMD